MFSAGSLHLPKAMHRSGPAPRPEAAA